MGSSKAAVTFPSGIIPTKKRKKSSSLKRRLHTLGRYAALLGGIALSGCGTLPNRRGWGEDATLLPGWDRLGKAFSDAALAPETWAPAVGAMAFQIGNADHAVSRWAMDNTPLYRSRSGADRASNMLLDSMEGLYGLSFIATPSGSEPLQWGAAKLKGGLVQGTALLLTCDCTTLLKNETGRLRPEGTDESSFPSSHAARAAVFGTMGAKNVAAMDVSPGTKTAAQWGFGALTAATGWARIEAGKHYPTDVLAGVAFGHFLGTFLNEAFLGVDSSTLVPLVEPSRNGIVLGVGMQF